MKITVNPAGAALNQYLMKMALPLGAYFIVEYLVRNYSASNIFLGFLNLPMMVITVVLVFIIMKGMRDKLLDGHIPGFMAWTFGVQLMLFAGLLEAAFIYVFNEFIVPTNLVTVHQQMLIQYQEVLDTVKALPNQGNMVASATKLMQDTIDLLKETPVSSPIETAMSMLSNNVFYGMFIMLFVAPIIKKK